LPVVKERFAGKEAEALAMVTTGSSIGGVIFPIMTSHLIDKVGFKWSMGASAFLNLFLLVIANLVFAVPVFLRWLDSKGSHGSERLRKPSRSLRAQLKETIKILRNDAPFMILVLGLLVYAFGYFAPINYIAAEAVANGVDTNLAQYLIPILNAARYE
jgi:MFS family permease